MNVSTHENLSYIIRRGPLQETMNIRTIKLILLILAVCGAGLAQGVTPESAQALFQGGKWKEAAGAYEVLADKEQDNVLYWSRLAYARQRLEDFPGAVRAYEKVLGLSKQGNSTMLYNLACAYARMNRKAKALEALNEAATAGFNQPNFLETDTDLENIRSETAFKAILARVQNNAAPCLNDPLHRQFDFWIGEWNVFNTQGQQAGQSSIQNILGGCVIFENWTGRTGYTGKSFNFVDPGTGKWRQTWVDAVGGKIEFTGGLEGKNMVFYSDGKDTSGTAFRRRLTFFNMGSDSVRQFSQRTVDEGKTWSVEYDFMYVRKN